MGFKGELLDQCLAAGYYRMMHTIFTTDFTQLSMEGEALPVFWLRTKVTSIIEKKKAIALRKLAAAFTVTIQPAAVSEATETLYQRYLTGIDFVTGATCSACMHDPMLPNPFNSHLIEVSDGDALIAAGYFDLGQKAMMGILNFYDPAYKKFSLGKYLMLKKIDYALANEIDWYYPGYIGTGFTKFDYKLFPDPGAMEVFLPLERQWVKYESIGKAGLQTYWYKHLVNQEK